MNRVREKEEDGKNMFYAKSWPKNFVNYFFRFVTQSIIKKNIIWETYKGSINVDALMSINRENYTLGDIVICRDVPFGRICPSTQFFYMLNVYPVYQIRTEKGSVDIFLWTSFLCGWNWGWEMRGWTNPAKWSIFLIDGAILDNLFCCNLPAQFSKIFKIQMLKFFGFD